MDCIQCNSHDLDDDGILSESMAAICQNVIGSTGYPRIDFRICYYYGKKKALESFEVNVALSGCTK